MFRILGFTIGSFLAVAALVLLVGKPGFENREADGSGQARMEAAIENLRRKRDEPEGPPLNSSPAPESTGLPAPPPDGAATPAATAAVQAAADAPTSVPDPAWHVFWSPFRTEIAARGFVSRLEAVTGLDYRVAKLRTGAWQVAFAYHSDAERQAGLEQIAAATGLDVAVSRR